MVTELPVLKKSAGGCGPVRPSKRSRWRALSLVLVHVAVALHVLHWYLTGSTLTPVEPSEAMQTLGAQALVNAGFVLFVVLILSTLVFGRFFCGWACHVVALQDLCTWILRKMRLQPKPLRSRLLVFIPLLSAIWMFVLPTLVRWMGTPRQPYQAHFVTDEFWERFPDWPIALLTFFVCGFLIVYFLGNKGFCTYGCPYGGIFGVADAVAPGKIRVTEACEGCGHCTATCTSNVRVHEEVKLYQMVVDPGCMKCMDCVNVCPKDALFFGFGTPSLNKGQARAEKKPPRHDFTWTEEAALALLFGVSIVVFRALYDAIPFLLALGLSAISAFVILTALRLFWRPDLSFARLRLRQGGRTSGSGIVFALSVALWVAFIAHSGTVKYLAFSGSRTVQSAVAMMSVNDPGRHVEARARAQQGVDRLIQSDRLALFDVPRVKTEIADALFGLADHEKAEAYYREASESGRVQPRVQARLAGYARQRGDVESAVIELEKVIQRYPKIPGVHMDLANDLVTLGRGAEALTMIETLAREHPENPQFQLSRAMLMTQLGQAGGLELTRKVVEQWPDLADAHFNLGRILAAGGRLEEALAPLERAVELKPQFAEGHFVSSQVATNLGRWDLARKHADTARKIEPFEARYLRTWARAVEKTGALTAEIATAESAGDRASTYRLIFLYDAAGRSEEARRIEGEFGSKRGPS